MGLILASTSPIRRQILEAAGVKFSALAPGVDERAIKMDVQDPQVVSSKLAEVKARAIARNHPGAWVIGSDSVVSVGTRLFDKPADRAEAAEHLRFFSGKEMMLTSAAALVREDVLEWSHSACARLRVRELSDPFIEAYLDAEWPEVGYCVGVFRLEGLGVQLFERVDGDHFTIFGLPLLPLLAALRERDLMPS